MSKRFTYDIRRPSIPSVLLPAAALCVVSVVRAWFMGHVFRNVRVSHEHRCAISSDTKSNKQAKPTQPNNTGSTALCKGSRCRVIIFVDGFNRDNFRVLNAGFMDLFSIVVYPTPGRRGFPKQPKKPKATQICCACCSTTYCQLPQSAAHFDSKINTTEQQMRESKRNGERERVHTSDLRHSTSAMCEWRGVPQLTPKTSPAVCRDVNEFTFVFDFIVRLHVVLFIVLKLLNEHTLLCVRRAPSLCFAPQTMRDMLTGECETASRGRVYVVWAEPSNVRCSREPRVIDLPRSSHHADDDAHRNGTRRRRHATNNMCLRSHIDNITHGDKPHAKRRRTTQKCTMHIRRRGSVALLASCMPDLKFCAPGFRIQYSIWPQI